MIRKMIIFGAIGTILVTSSILTNIITKALSIKRLEIVKTYITCLDENFGQRDYCAKQQNMNYRIIDQYAEYYGWNFDIDGSGNLKITRSAEY